MMMRLSRRDFLKYCSIAAGTLGLSSGVLLKLEQAAANANGPDVVWLQGAGCNGCTVSFANSIFNGNTPAHLLIDVLNLAYHPTLMAAAGTKAVDSAYGANNTTGTPFVLVVEGAIQNATPPGPIGNTNIPGDYCKIWDHSGTEENMLTVTRAFAQNAAVVLAIGNCASYGGIPGATGNVTDARGVYDSLTEKADKKKVVNIPGCPAHPDWFVGTVAYIIDAVARQKSRLTPNLDSLRRPAEYFPERNCNSCSRFTKGTIAHPTSVPGKGVGFASNPGEQANLCLKYVGCRGSRTKSDCPTRKWNADATMLGSGVNWCVGAGANCAGCTQPYFPDRFTPLYGIK